MGCRWIIFSPLLTNPLRQGWMLRIAEPMTSPVPTACYEPQTAAVEGYPKVQIPKKSEDLFLFSESTNLEA